MYANGVVKEWQVVNFVENFVLCNLFALLVFVSPLISPLFSIIRQNIHFSSNCLFVVFSLFFNGYTIFCLYEFVVEFVCIRPNIEFYISFKTIFDIIHLKLYLNITRELTTICQIIAVKSSQCKI